MRRFLALSALVLLASCSSLPAASWCYRFDFTTSDYGFDIIYGRWTPGGGLTPDDAGRFVVTYTYSQPVTPTGVIITAARADTMPLAIKVVGKADIFGIEIGTLQTLVPEDVTSATITIPAGNGPGTSPKFEITGEATRTILLQTMDIRGNGSNPFPASNCDTAAYDSSPRDLLGGVADDVLDTLSEADQQLESVNGSLTAPDGSPLLPDTAQLGTIFGLAKWIISPGAVEEIADPFAPVLIGFAMLLLLNIALVVVYVIIYAAVYLVRWVLWLFRLIEQIAVAIAAAAATATLAPILAGVLGVAVTIAALLALFQRIAKALGFGG